MEDEITLEEEIKYTKLDHVFNHANVIFPITANSLNPSPIIKVEVLEYTEQQLLDLIYSLNSTLKVDDPIERTEKEQYILDSIKFFRDDYNEYTKYYWFNCEGMKKLIKWCEPREKGLFD